MQSVIKRKKLWLAQGAFKNNFAVALIFCCVLPAYKADIVKTKLIPTNYMYAKAKEVPIVEDLTKAKIRTENEKVYPHEELTCTTNDKGFIDTFAIIEDKLQEQLYQLINAERPATDPKHYRLPNLLYKACMNEKQIESLDTRPVDKEIFKILAWPVYMGFGANSIFTFKIEPDFNNSSRRIIVLDQPSFGLERAFLVKGPKERLVTAYYNYMVDIAVRFGANKTRAQEELFKSLEFEIALAKISLPAEELKDLSKLYNLHTMRQLQEKYPYFQWLSFINSVLPKAVAIAEDEIVNVRVPKFFEELGPLLLNTPNRIIANYTIWHVRLNSVPYLSKDFRKRQLQYKEEREGTQIQKPRWKECVDTVSAALPIAVGSLYVQKYFNQKTKAIVLDMINNIKMVFKDPLNNASWMDNLIKEEIILKLSHLLDDKKLADYYDKLDINENEYYASILKVKEFHTGNEYKKLHQPFAKTTWKDFSRLSEVNFFYKPSANSVQIFSGLLQGHFLNAQSKFIGVLDWWQENRAREFLIRAQCVINHCGRYKHYLERIGIEPRSSGQNFSPQQMFWIAFAKTWCDTNSRMYDENRVLMDPIVFIIIFLLFM